MEKRRRPAAFEQATLGGERPVEVATLAGEANGNAGIRPAGRIECRRHLLDATDAPGHVRSRRVALDQQNLVARLQSADSPRDGQLSQRVSVQHRRRLRHSRRGHDARRADGCRRREFEYLGLLTGPRLALDLQPLRQRRRLRSVHQGRQRARGADCRPGTVAEKLNQAVGAFRPVSGAEIGLVRDALAIERQDVGEIGPPFHHLQGEVPRSGRPPDLLELAGRRPRSTASPQAAPAARRSGRSCSRPSGRKSPASPAWLNTTQGLVTVPHGQIGWSDAPFIVPPIPSL